MPAARETFRSRLREVWDVLAFTFDFDIFERPLGSDEYATPAPWLPAFVVPGATVSVVGRDGTGGVYICCERGRRGQVQHGYILHVDTRGNAACIGEELRQAVALVVALPYWPELLAECRPGAAGAGRDELRASGRPLGGPLAALRELAVHLEREAAEDLPALPAARKDLQSFLELPVLADPVGHLYRLAVEQPPPVTVWSPHGWRYESPLQSVAEHGLPPAAR
jgi:hypothetical protein